jgi:hypothetical protein
MSDDLKPDPDLPPESGGKLKFVLIALAPIPMGLLIAGGLGHSTSPDDIKGTAVLIAVLTFAGSVVGSIGLNGGFGKEVRPKALVAGFFQGVLLFCVEFMIIFFAGCAIVLTHL